MISLIQHIEYLMMYHDCVVVPGWGALIANNISSVSKGCHIGCPSRVIGFNSSIKHNDGMLATSLSRRHGMTYEQSCKFIEDTITVFRQQLNAGVEVAFGHLGVFSLNKSGKMEFMPLSGVEMANEFYGLCDLEFNLLSQQRDENEPAQIVPVLNWRERLKVVSSAAAILALGILFSTPAIVDNTSQTASMGGVEIKTTPAQNITVKKVSQATRQDMSFELIDDNKTDSQVESDFNEGMPCKGEYLLVINTCNKSRQAKKIIEHYAKRGIKAVEVERGKYHHIVVAKSNDEKELLKAKELLPEKYRKAWVCK